MTKQDTFKKVRLFQLSKEFNVTVDTITQHLETAGYEDAVKGKGINAAVTEEDAYLELLHAFADDKAAASRLKEKRAEARLAEEDAAEDSGVTTLESEVPVAQPEPEPEPEPGPESEPVPVPAPLEDDPEIEDEPELVPPAEEEIPAEDVPPAETIIEEVMADDDEVPVDDRMSPMPAPTQEPLEEEPEPEIDDAEEVEDVVPEIEPDVVEAEEPAEEVEAETDAVAADAVTELDADEVADIKAPEGVVAVPESVLKASRYNLQGTTVLGKIDLSKVDDDSSGKKRKRKRKGGEKPAETPKAAPAKSTPAAASAAAAKKKPAKKKRGPQVDEGDVEQTLQDTLRELEMGASRVRQRRRRDRRQTRAEAREAQRLEQEDEQLTLRVTEFVSTGELAALMDIDVNDVIRVLFQSGMMVSINQRLDADTISFVADEFGREVQFITEFGTDDIRLEVDDPADLKPRPPIVTVMGHVDHGKTSLLDYIRSANVVAGEAGGITQHIGAYKVEITGGRGEISFLDTPGHEAFTAMRARGAKVTDVVILVVAADDSVMPQTIEAINHARAAEVPVVVAINKIDKPEINTQRVMQQLADHNVLVEQYGGKVQCAFVSAHTGEGVDDLLDKVLLEAELRELTGNPNRNASGYVIESRLEKGRGAVATVLIQNGTLRVGDVFVAGIHSGRVRAMFDERDNRISEVGPSEPALILGFNGSPEVGDQFIVLDEEKDTRDIAQRRQQIHREQSLRQKKHITLDEIGRRLALGDFRELNLIVKADVGGSVEALADSLLKLSTEEVALNIIHSGVGAITESDVMLASASDAVIIGFQVRPSPGARQLAEREEIDVRTYSIIYQAIEDVRDALEGLLSPEKTEVVLSTVEVREIFKVPKAGTVAGSYVLDGKIKRNEKIRIVRDGVVIYTGSIAALRRFKDDVREVAAGYECGISIENFNDIKVGDLFETFKIVEEKRKLEI
jgi:translation initiation factor IF-2